MEEGGRDTWIIEEREVRSPGRGVLGVCWYARQVGWTSEWKGGRFLGTSSPEKEKLKSSAESWEEEGRRLGTD